MHYTTFSNYKDLLVYSLYNNSFSFSPCTKFCCIFPLHFAAPILPYMKCISVFQFSSLLAAVYCISLYANSSVTFGLLNQLGPCSGRLWHCLHALTFRGKLAPSFPNIRTAFETSGCAKSAATYCNIPDDGNPRHQHCSLPQVTSCSQELSAVCQQHDCILSVLAVETQAAVQQAARLQSTAPFHWQLRLRSTTICLVTDRAFWYPIDVTSLHVTVAWRRGRCRLYSEIYCVP